jgi:hypothetical protein
MLGGGVLGALAGMLYNGLVLGQRVPAITIALALLGESLLASRVARRAAGRPLTPDQRTRLAIYYSVGFAVLVTAVFAIKPSWLPHTLMHRLEDLSGTGVAVALGFAVLAVSATALLRYLLLSLLSPRK